MTELDPLIKAFVKTLEEANIITATSTHDLTSLSVSLLSAYES